MDGEVYALSSTDNPIRAEFVETLGDEGAEERIAWRLYDRFGRGVLLMINDISKLSMLTENYLEERAKDDR